MYFHDCRLIEKNMSRFSNMPFLKYTSIAAHDYLRIVFHDAV